MTKKKLPEVLRDPIYGNHCCVQLQDVKLHYVECGPKSKELLLFVHGFPDFWFSWKSQIKEFSKDYWVVALDMRGYGDSDKSRKISYYKMNLLVSDIRNFVLHLGRRKFTLVAHDWGGVVAHYFIRSHPAMLHRYILINTVFLPKLGRAIWTSPKQFFKSWYIILMQIPIMPEFFFIGMNRKRFEYLFKHLMTEKELEAYKFTFGSYEKIRGPINYYRASFRNWRKLPVPTADELNQRNVPGLYIHGKKDLALTLSTSFDKSFQDVRNVRCVAVADAGHFVHIHSSTDVNDIIRNFIQTTAN